MCMHMIDESMKCVCARVPHLHITMCRCCSVPEVTQGANKWNTCCEGCITVGVYKGVTKMSRKGVSLWSAYIGWCVYKANG